MPRHHDDDDDRTRNDGDHHDRARSAGSSHDRHRTPRELLYVTKCVPLADFTRDLVDGTISSYAELPRDELQRRFGTPVVPIFVPLARGETEQQYEQRFEAWLWRTECRTLDEVARDTDRTYERWLRKRFAAANAKGRERFGSERQEDTMREDTRYQQQQRRSRSPMRAVSSHRARRSDARSLSPAHAVRSAGSSAPRNAYHPVTGEVVPREQLYVKKYVELDDFKKHYKNYKMNSDTKLTDEEKQAKFGSTILPIFVPLARGESMTQYEERFVEWLQRRGLTLHEVEHHNNPARERHLRIYFANLNASGVEQFVPPRSKRALEERDVSPAPPTKKMARGGREPSIAAISSSKGETDTFESTTLDVIKAHQSKDARPPSATCRTVDMLSRKEPVDASTGEKLLGKCSFRAPPDGSLASTVAQAYTQCGCRQCLVEGMRFLTAKVAELGKNENSTRREDSTRNQVIDLTQEEESHSPKNKSSRISDTLKKLVTSKTARTELQEQLTTTTHAVKANVGDISDDPVKRLLLNDYAKLNNTVLAYEQQLGDLAAKLLKVPLTDTTETARLQDKCQGLREVLETEFGNRTAALATLIVYEGRRKSHTLEHQVKNSPPSNVLHIQRMSHAKCSSLIGGIDAKQKDVAEIKQQLDREMTKSPGTEDFEKHLTQLRRWGHALTKIEDELRELLAQQQVEFSKLIEFDEQLRVEILRKLSTPR